MNPSLETSTRSGRTGRIAMLTAPPLVALAFAVYAFSGLHTEADAASDPVDERAASLAAAPRATNAAPTEVDDVPVTSQHDAELLNYRPHGG